MADRNAGPGDATESVSVSIGGREYRLRGSDPDALRRIAARVDGTLAELAGPGRTPDDFKLAVLTALNIAGEQDDARAAWLDRAAALRERAAGLVDRLERLAASVPEPSDDVIEAG